MTPDVLFVGIDISKFKHDVAIMDENKNMVCRTFVVKESRDGYLYLLDRLDQMKRKHRTKRFYIGMEATADYWKNLFYYFKEQPDCTMVVINPVQTKAFAKAELRRAKTDPVNAKDIAQFLVEKRPSASNLRTPVCDNIKDMDSQIRALKKQNSMNINRLRGELGKTAPEIEHNVPVIAGRQILALLMNFPTAADIDAASVEELCRIKYGKKQWPLPVAFITKMKALSKNSIAHKKGQGAGLVVQFLAENIMQCQTKIQTLNEQMEQLYKQINPETSLLTSIKGISTKTAIVLEAYIGDVTRFPNSKKFVAYFGMNPTVNQSGTKKKNRSHLQKRGSGVVRHKLFMATLCMIRYDDSPIYGFYHRLVDAGKPKLVAVCAAMRKLLVIIYNMLKNKEKFDPDKSKTR
jgi:transposase